ncbi:MAG: hypothetical protein HZA09_04490 [Nitrospirae bacterium]|nr:hypothetical protein [Nitrospirota bacterium]
MKKYDKSLTEVWEWKMRVYQDIKDLTPKEYIEKIRNDADKILSGAGVKLTPVPPKKEHQRIA